MTYQYIHDQNPLIEQVKARAEIEAHGGDFVLFASENGWQDFYKALTILEWLGIR